MSRSAPTACDTAGEQNATESESEKHPPPKCPVSDIVRMHVRKKKSLLSGATPPSSANRGYSRAQRLLGLIPSGTDALTQTILIVTCQKFTSDRAGHGYFVRECGFHSGLTQHGAQLRQRVQPLTQKLPQHHTKGLKNVAPPNVKGTCFHESV